MTSASKRKTHKKRGGTKRKTAPASVIRNSRVTKSRITNRKSINQSLKPIQLETILEQTPVLEPVFFSTDGEHVIEANLTFLIELMGGSIYDIYVKYFLNVRLNNGNKIQVKNVERPMNPENAVLAKGEPTIFYGTSSGTHFTCSTGDGRLIDPYKIGIQKNGTDHFCQTFSLMYMEHYFFPESKIGNYFKQMFLNGGYKDNSGQMLFYGNNKNYLYNVMNAIQAACFVIGTVYNFMVIQKEKVFGEKKEIFDFNEIFFVTLHNADKNKTIRHKTNFTENDFMGEESQDITINKVMNGLLNYCRQLTAEQLFESSFIQKIFDLADHKAIDTFRKNNRYIIE